MTGKISSYFRMGKGADAWFKHVNETGGIHGRMVNFKMVDDKYEPARTKTLVKRFIERDKCFAIVAPLGSAPTAAVIDYITSKNVPLIGAGTGAEKNPHLSQQVRLPALSQLPHGRGRSWCVSRARCSGSRRSACSIRTTPRARPTWPGIESVLDQYGVELVAAEGYDQKEIDVSAQVISLKNAGAEAMLCSCAPEPAARFYTERKKLGWDVPVINVFFGKSPKVPELAGADAVEGVYFTTIFRDFNSPAPQIQEAKALLTKYYPEETPDAIHLWGFTGAQVFTEAMRRMGPDNLTRDRPGRDAGRHRRVEGQRGSGNHHRRGQCARALPGEGHVLRRLQGRCIPGIRSALATVRQRKRRRLQGRRRPPPLHRTDSLRIRTSIRPRALPLPLRAAGDNARPCRAFDRPRRSGGPNRQPHAKPGRHAADRMLRHVAVQHPVPGVVGDECDLDCLATVDEQGVAQRARGAVGRDRTEVVPMQVHPVRPRRVVDHRETNGLASFRREQRRFGHLREPVERPDLALCGQVHVLPPFVRPASPAASAPSRRRPCEGFRAAPARGRRAPAPGLGG